MFAKSNNHEQAAQQGCTVIKRVLSTNLPTFMVPALPVCFKNHDFTILSFPFGRLLWKQITKHIAAYKQCEE